MCQVLLPIQLKISKCKANPSPSEHSAPSFSTVGLSFKCTVTDSSTYREARERAEQEEYERNNPKIQQQFADLKRALGSVSDEDWANLPEVGDMTGKNRRTKQALRQRFYAVPDSVLAGARDSSELGNTINDGGSADSGDGTMTNFKQIGEARDKVLQVKLDQASQSGGSDSVAGSATSIDPRGYLTSLAKSQISDGENQVGDINRVRALLESVIKTNPKHGPGWIAACRLEELAGKTVAARNVIARGCEFCPRNEDVWLESIRLNENHNAKIIAAQAIRSNNTSVKLWVQAMELESDPGAKKRVLRKALDHIPQSVELWKEAVNLEEDVADAKLMLAKATEIIPLSVELWLALARLETSENAQKVLNKARKANPNSHEIWIAAARLQEQTSGNTGKINVMNRAVKALAKESAMLKREDWITEAEKCESEGAVLTCGNIIRETLGWGLDEDDDRKDIWMEDAKSCIGRGNYETARAIYAYAIRVFVNSRSLWLEAANLEKTHGTKEALLQLLEKATEACPQAQVLWMMWAKEMWQSGDLHGARVVLAKAFKQNPDNEDIWLAAVKLEAENGEHEQARKLLESARQQAPTDRVWMKSVAFERQLGNSEAALDLVNQALQLFPAAPKLWMMKGQIYEGEGKPPQARDAYSTGTKACPKSVPLWLLFSRLEERVGMVVKARGVLDRARLAVPKNPELWAESVRVERRATPNNLSQAKNLMAKALQECPTSGLLYSESILYLEGRTQRKPRALEAIKKVDNDPHLFVTISRIFWAERKLEKAQNWFEKALLIDTDLGDSWAWYYCFLLQHGTEEKKADLISKCIANESSHGEVWQSVAKDPRNAGKGIEEILKLTADKLKEELFGA